MGSNLHVVTHPLVQHKLTLMRRKETPTAEFRAQLIGAVPAYQIALDGMPLPNQPFAAGANVGFYQAGKSGHARDNHTVAKADFRLTSNTNLAVTYTHGRPYRQEPSPDLHNDGTFRGFQERGTPTLVTGGAAWTSETRFGYNLNDLETNRPVSAARHRRGNAVWQAHAADLDVQSGFSGV